jgi:hypothetical protein
MASRLKVNLEKSRIMCSKSVSRRKKCKISQLSSICTAGELGKYLGFPLIQYRVKKEHFNFVIEKIERRLSDWKMKMLNKAGRTTLAKSVLMALPVYSMQSFWLLETTCLRIDKTVRRFIWGEQRG